MPSDVVIAIDQGTTGTRAILYNRAGEKVSSAYQEFKQYYPRPGWVEHDPEEIWETCRAVLNSALRKARFKVRSIAAIGITNQRETCVLWDARTGKPVHRAIVWQDRRTSELCRQLKKGGHEALVRRKTGLTIDPYFSASKIHWLIQNLPGIKSRLKQKRILFGTIDTWLIWKLTGGKSYATDFTNASRTLLFDIRTKKWDKHLFKLFSISGVRMPAVFSSGSLFGRSVKTGRLPSGVPIHAVMGDQQAALYGQACYQPGMTKNTYGTGCFLVTNIGEKYLYPPKGLLLTLACDIHGNPVYAFEGSVFIAGAAIQWLRDGMRFFGKSYESERLALKVKDSAGVTVIPAFVGLGSPYWNPDVRGIISGITRGTQREHIIRATLESIAHQSVDILDLIGKQTRIRINSLQVDGGATRNHFLMQCQADFSGIPIAVSDVSESTAWGVAKLAGKKKAGFWRNTSKINAKPYACKFLPRISKKERMAKREKWKSEVSRLLS